MSTVVDNGEFEYIEGWLIAVMIDLFNYTEKKVFKSEMFYDILIPNKRERGKQNGKSKCYCSRI